MYRTKSVSLIIPCYNEQDGLEGVLRRKPAFIDDVIVVNNGSTDRTASIARSFGVTVVHEKIRGYGQAIIAGINRSGGDILVIIDGDGSYPVTEVQRIIGHMEATGCDFVYGNRYPLADKSAQPFLNRAANRIISRFIRILFRVDIRDSQSGMMAFTRTFLSKIDVNDLGRDFSFSQEIKIKAFTRRDIRCGAVSIPYGIRAGKVKFRKMTDSFKNVVGVLFLWQGFQRVKASYDLCRY